MLAFQILPSRGLSTLPPSYFNPSRFMLRTKEIPRTGAFLRSSVHLEQISLGLSVGRGKVLAITPSKTPLWSMKRNHPTVLPSSTFCQSPAAVGSEVEAWAADV